LAKHLPDVWRGVHVHVQPLDATALADAQMSGASGAGAAGGVTQARIEAALGPLAMFEVVTGEDRRD
jgi:hypothetical protein